jgi:beta-galactosidase
VPGRRYDELKKTIAALTPVMEKIEGSGSPAEAAILYSYDANSALKIQPCHPKLEYREQVRAYYGGLYKRNVATDFVGVADDFSRYKLLVAPVLYLVTPELREKLWAYAEAGGCLALTMRSGVKDATNKMLLDDGARGLQELAGLRVDDYTTLHRGSVPFAWENGGADEGMLWCDVITPDGCETLAGYTGGYFAGTPAVTAHTVGKGRVFYVGTCLGDAGMDKLAALLLEHSGVESLGDSAPGVEITAREGENGKFLFVMNHNEAETSFCPPESWKPVLASDGDALKPFEVRVYRDMD